MKKQQLTIVIPTFNRKEKCRGLINILEPQCIKYDVKIVIMDNCSIEYIYEKADDIPNNINYIRQDINIGPVANILRGIEIAQSDWVSVICDDDLVAKNYVEKVIGEIEKNDYKKTIALKFRSNLDINFNRKKINSSLEFSEYNCQENQFSATLFISTWVFNKNIISNYIRFGYMYATSQAFHLVMLAAALEKKRNIIYSDEMIIENPDQEGGWDAGLTYLLMITSFKVIHIFSPQEKSYYMMGIIGNSARRIAGSIYRMRSYQNGEQAKLVTDIISKISFKHYLMTIFVPIIIIIMPNKILKKYQWSNNGSIDNM